MNRYEMVTIVVTVMTTGITLSTIARAWLLRATRQQPRPEPQRDAAVEARLARIEHAIESVAVEVERISENQRFTTRLLAEREPQLIGDGAAPRAREGGHAR